MYRAYAITGATMGVRGRASKIRGMLGNSNPRYKKRELRVILFRRCARGKGGAVRREGDELDRT